MTAEGAVTVRAVAAALVLVAAVPGMAAASDARLVRLAGVTAPAVRAGLAAAGPADPAGTQRAYDRARGLMEDTAAVRPSPGCRPLAAALRRFALAAVRVPEAVDRLVSPGPARARADAAYAGVRAAAAGCAPGGGGTAAAPAPRMSPGPGEVAFGTVVADAPAGADAAELVIDGVPAGALAVRDGRARGALRATPGRHTVRVVFTRRGAPAGARTATGAWVLPPGSAVARPATRADAGARARLRAIGVPARPVLGLWVQDLSTGTAAGWNAGTAFPAASTVKLAVMVAALARDPRSPATGPLAYDLRQIGGWSSNLAANRVLAATGGPAMARRVLVRLGAVSSTYTGDYAVGTELRPAVPDDAVRPVPRVSGRVTTAADLARVLFTIHAAACGDRAARSASGLSARAARVLLGDLLASEQRGDNVSLFASGVPAGTLLAQKNGWLRAARHGAAILYPPDGPRIAVMLGYSAEGMPQAGARALGARVAAVATG